MAEKEGDPPLRDPGVTNPDNRGDDEADGTTVKSKDLAAEIAQQVLAALQQQPGPSKGK